MRRYLDCGILEKGFSRIRCPECGEERLLAFQTDPLLCPKCGSTTRILAFIDDPPVVYRNLKHIHYRIDPLPFPSRAPPPEPLPSQLQFSSDWV